MNESPTRQFCLAGLTPAIQCFSNFPPQQIDGFDLLVWAKSRGVGSRNGDTDGIPALIHGRRLPTLQGAETETGQDDVVRLLPG